MPRTGGGLCSLLLDSRALWKQAPGSHKTQAIGWILLLAWSYHPASLGLKLVLPYLDKDGVSAWV